MAARGNKIEEGGGAVILEGQQTTMAGDKLNPSLSRDTPARPKVGRGPAASFQRRIAMVASHLTHHDRAIKRHKVSTMDGIEKN